MKFGYLGMPGMSWATTTNVFSAQSTESAAAGTKVVNMSRSYTSPPLMAPPCTTPPRRGSASTISSMDSQPFLFADNTVHSVLTSLGVKRQSPQMNRSMSSDPFTSHLAQHQKRYATRDFPVGSTDGDGFALPLTPSKSSFKSSTTSLLSSSASSSSSTFTKASFILPRSPLKLHRRHHCRRCGASFCDSHAGDVVALLLTHADDGRTAAKCSQGSRSGEDGQSQDRSQLQPLPQNHNSLTHASSVLRDLLGQGTPSGKGGSISNKAARVFHGRVCKECLGYYQYFKQKYIAAANDLAECRRSRRGPEHRSFVRPERSIDENPLSPNRTGTLADSDFATPYYPAALDAFVEARDYLDSKERIRQEQVREAVEVLKTLRNDTSANRTVAAAVAMGPHADSPSALRKYVSTMSRLRSESPADGGAVAGSTYAASSRGSSPLPAGRPDPFAETATRTLEPLTRLGRDSEDGNADVGHSNAERSIPYTGLLSPQSCTGIPIQHLRFCHVAQHEHPDDALRRTMGINKRQKTVEEHDLENELRCAAQSTIAIAAGPAPKPRRTGWVWGLPQPQL